MNSSVSNNTVLIYFITGVFLVNPWLAASGILYPKDIVLKENDFNQPRSVSKFIYFAGQRNRSHFKMVKDPLLVRYFAPDFVWHLATFAGPNEFHRMMHLLRQYNNEIIIGFYSSACTAMPSQDDLFPPARLPLEEAESQWLLRDSKGREVNWPKNVKRVFLDMRKQSVRQAVIGLAVARAKYYGFDALCFDNCYWGYGIHDISEEEWTQAFMEFYREAGRASHQNDLLCIVNIATKADEIDDAFVAIAPYVDGLMTEMAFHPNLRSPDAVQAELKGYETLLKQGKKVFLFPKNNSDLVFALSAIRPLAEKYGNIYLCNKGKLIPSPLYDIYETKN